jgi:DNA helicase-2/ATP-dependent DNA helicase PcrA
MRQVNPSWGSASLSQDLPLLRKNSDTAITVVSKKPSEHGFYVGQQVFHAKFGEGRLTGLEGLGTDARAQVQFARHGVKWLQLSIAKLTPI